MDLLANPLLRQALAPRDPDPHAEPRKRLLDALLQMRERAKMLAGEIHRDLPDFTVHDITHLDALWEMADLIAGPDYPLNPLEAFALGAVFLLPRPGPRPRGVPRRSRRVQERSRLARRTVYYLRKHLEYIPIKEDSDRSFHFLHTLTLVDRQYGPRNNFRPLLNVEGELYAC
jgi:hypothetical protein